MTCKCEKRGAKESLVIMAMQDGGFVVADQIHDGASRRPFLYACSTIEQALDYIKTEMRSANG